MEDEEESDPRRHGQAADEEVAQPQAGPAEDGAAEQAAEIERAMMAKDKVHKVMGEYKRGTLRSGSKHGPKVKSRKQAVAIALSEKRRGKK